MSDTIASPTRLVLSNLGEDVGKYIFNRQSTDLPWWFWLRPQETLCWNKELHRSFSDTDLPTYIQIKKQIYPDIFKSNKLASLGYASPKLRLTYRLTYLLTGVKCRATSVAKNRSIHMYSNQKTNLPTWRANQGVCLPGHKWSVGWESWNFQEV